MHCRLPCRVSAPDNEDVLGPGKRSFARAGAIVQTGSDILLLVRQTEVRVFDAGRTDDSAGDDLRAVSKVADPLPRLEFAADSFARR